jgi:hypothetical protein
MTFLFIAASLLAAKYTKGMDVMQVSGHGFQVRVYGL